MKGKIRPSWLLVCSCSNYEQQMAAVAVTSAFAGDMSINQAPLNAGLAMTSSNGGESLVESAMQNLNVRNTSILVRERIKRADNHFVD
jgi:hypothetical protein